MFEPATRQPATWSQRKRVSCSRGARVLLIEDDASIAGMLQEFLHDEGHRVEWASSPQQAVQTLKARQPAGVCIDLLLLDLNVREAEDAAQLQEYLDGADGLPPVIGLSTGVESSAEKLKLPSRAVGLVRKPFDLWELLAQIEVCLPSGAQHPPNLTPWSISEPPTNSPG